MAAPGSGTEPNYELLYLTVKGTVPFAVRNLCIQIAFSSAIITLYIFLLFLSGPHHRRTVTFALVSFITALFFVTAFTNSIQLTHSLSQPEVKNPLSIEFTDAFITLCLPWFADWVIFLRALALVPPRERKQTKWLTIFGLILFIKVIRGAFLIYLCEHLHRQMQTSMTPADLGTKVWPIAWSTWVEYAGMLIDTTICSAICVIRLRTLMTPSRSESRSRALQERLRLLLANTLSSFIFPVISTIVMIILAAVSTFEVYASAPKVNSGVVAMNVLIAMLIPIIDSSVAENRSFAQRDAAITDSFLRRNKSRSLSVPTQASSSARSTKGLTQQQQQQQNLHSRMLQRFDSGGYGSPLADKEVLEMERTAQGHFFGRRGTAATFELGPGPQQTPSPRDADPERGVLPSALVLSDGGVSPRHRSDTVPSISWAANAAAAAGARAGSSHHGGEGSATEAASYEPSMVEKTPVLAFSEGPGSVSGAAGLGLGHPSRPGGGSQSHDGYGYGWTTTSSPMRSGPAGESALSLADGSASGSGGTRPFVSVTQSPFSLEGHSPVSPAQPPQSSPPQQQQSPARRTSGAARPSIGSSATSRAGSVSGPAPTGPLPPSPKEEGGPLATTDDDRVLLRSMPRRQQRA